MQVSDRTRETRVTVTLTLVCLVLQLALSPNVALGSGRANFMLVLAVCLALVSPGRRAVVMGFVAGLLFDLSSTGPIGLMSLLLCVTAYVASGREAPASRGIGGLMAPFGVASVAVSLAYSLVMLALGQTAGLPDALVFRALPTAALTIVGSVPFAHYLSRTGSTGRGIAAGRLSGRGGL